MTPPDVLARALAAVLVDGEWNLRAMLARVRDALGGERPWMETIVHATRSRYRVAPTGALDELAAWLWSREEFRAAVFDRRRKLRFLRYATPAPEMAESP